MLRQTQLTLKKGWTYHPGTAQRGAKNLAWRPKIGRGRLEAYFSLYAESTARTPNVWHELEFRRLGLVEWPKEVGFYNAGDNFEITPAMMYRLFQHNCEESFWTAQHNEKAIIHLLPLMEKSPAETLPKVQEIFQSHMRRFGADHCIYNAALQAYAFGKDIAKCKAVFEEMKAVGLDPNAQTYVNMMLASKLSGEPREKVEEWFTMAVKDEALVPVMRLDTEFQMWWDQFERLGSFTAKEGFLAATEEGASARPADMFATWGWDRRVERKFVSRQEYIRAETSRRVAAGKGLYGTVFNTVKRRPWANYKGMRREDWSGPNVPPKAADVFADRPAPEFNRQKAGLSY